jgi:hypothetical protein
LNCYLPSLHSFPISTLLQLDTPGREQKCITDSIVLHEVEIMHPTPKKCPQTKPVVQPAALPTQMVVGFLPHGTPRSCVVVAEGWPSWLFVAPTLQLCCVKFYSDSLDSAWMITLLQHFPQLDVVDLNSLTENDLSFYPTDIVLLMQGNRSSLDGWMKQISTSRLCLLSLSIGHRPLNTGYWHDVFHESCGGVTSGSWSVGCDKPFLWSTPSAFHD